MKRILSVVVACSAVAAWGQTIKGDDFVDIKSLNSQCEAGPLMQKEPTMQNALKAGHCMGYIRGIQEYVLFRNMFGRALCFPDGFKPADISDAEDRLQRALKNPPSDSMGFFAVLQVSAMLNEKYACKN